MCDFDCEKHKKYYGIQSLINNEDDHATPMTRIEAKLTRRGKWG